jgi:formate dehydrogenase subunit delta
MDIENLIKMANRVGDFFDAYPDREEACGAVADHLRRFWEPRMRREIFAKFDAGSTPELMPIVQEALRKYRATLLPPPAAPLQGQGRASPRSM